MQFIADGKNFRLMSFVFSVVANKEQRYENIDINDRVQITYADTLNLDVTRMLCHIGGLLCENAKTSTYEQYIRFGYMDLGYKPSARNPDLPYHVFNKKTLIPIHEILKKITVILKYKEFNKYVITTYREDYITPSYIGLDIDTTNVDIDTLKKYGEVYATNKGFHVYIPLDDCLVSPLKRLVDAIEKLPVDLRHVALQLFDRTGGFIFTEQWRFNNKSKEKLEHHIEQGRNALEVNMNFQIDMSVKDHIELLHAFGYQYLHSIDNDLFNVHIFYHPTKHCVAGYNDFYECLITNDKQLLTLLNSSTIG